MFPKYHTYEFEATLIHLKNVSAISIDNINEAVATALANSKSKKEESFALLVKDMSVLILNP